MFGNVVKHGLQCLIYYLDVGLLSNYGTRKILNLPLVLNMYVYAFAFIHFASYADFRVSNLSDSMFQESV